MKLSTPSATRAAFAARAAAAALAAFAAASTAFAAQLLQGSSDKDFYKVGEEITFTFSVEIERSPDGPSKVEYERSGDDGVKEKKLVLVEPGDGFEVKTKMDKPGFVHIDAHLLGEDGKRQNRRETRWMAAAGVEPEKLQPVPEPDDFDAFWATQKARLAEAEWKGGAKRESVESQTGKFEVSKISVPVVDGVRPVTAWLLVPVGAAPKSLKLSLRFKGYGVGKDDPPREEWLDGKEIVVDVNAHGYELGRDTQYYKDFEKSIQTGNDMYGFDKTLNQDPAKTYFNGMILRDLRAIDFGRTLPEWDGKNIKVSGGSQGGFQALLLAALDPLVTEADANAPWLCDMGGKSRLGRVFGWQPQFTDAMNYYESAHHAKRVPPTCKVLISRAGLGDTVCPPSGIAAVYNNLSAPKKIVYVQGSEHGDWGKMPDGTQTFSVSEGF